MPHCLQWLSMCGSSSGRGQALLSRCTARRTYMHKCRQGAGETVPKHYTVLHTSYHSSIRTHMIGKITKSMASLHARTLIRSFGQVDNCVDYKDITWGFLKIHNFTYIILYVQDTLIAGWFQSTLVHIKHSGGERKQKSVICEVPCKNWEYANNKETR